MVVHFSQTGQLLRCAQSFAAPLMASDDVIVDWCALEPQVPYPFPWPFFTFFDQFPETVKLIPPKLKPIPHAGERYDLIILAYTVWFLSPAPPVTAFLKSDEGRALLRDTPVVTLIACRNMWHLAQEDTKQMLAAAGARLSDNVVLTDRGPSFATFITTPRWMLTGRKGAFWGFPAAGLQTAQIDAAGRFGRAILGPLLDGTLDGNAPVLQGLEAVQADVRLVPSEHIGRRSFAIWGSLIRRCGPLGHWARRPVLLIYALFLTLMILTVVPVTMLLRTLLRPLSARRQRQQQDYFERPSGRDGSRMNEYGNG